jgi:hypothetical protein
MIRGGVVHRIASQKKKYWILSRGFILARKWKKRRMSFLNRQIKRNDSKKLHDALELLLEEVEAFLDIFEVFAARENNFAR